MADDLSILNSIKQMLGLDAGYDAFDMEIKIYINSAFSTFDQVAGSPKKGFTISSDAEKWSDLLGDLKDVEFVKTYIYLKVKQIFDPSPTSFGQDAVKALIAEHEFRLNVMELVFNPNSLDYLKDDPELIDEPLGEFRQDTLKALSKAIIPPHEAESIAAYERGKL